MNNWITPDGYKTGIEEIAPKVYAYIQAFGELGVSNAGLLLDKDGVTAVDALMVPSMTRRFLDAVKKVTKRPVTRLVNTHHHIDHIGGNSFRGPVTRIVVGLLRPLSIVRQGDGDGGAVPPQRIQRQRAGPRRTLPVRQRLG